MRIFMYTNWTHPNINKRRGLVGLKVKKNQVVNQTRKEEEAVLPQRNLVGAIATDVGLA